MGYLVSIVGIAYYSILIVSLGSHNHTALAPPVARSPHPIVSEVQTRLPAQAGVGLPVRIKIPKLDIAAALESVGLAPDGDVGVPKGPTDAAWFNLSSRPGEVGSAVIVGHYGWKDNIPAVFDELSILKKGDTVYVEDDTGTTTTFVVRAVRTYGEHEDPPAVFNSSDGKAHLNLITCGGVWSAARKSYSDRIVVFTDEV